MAVIRLATCIDVEDEVSDVIRALKNEDKEFIFWGHPMGFPCDYLFVHSHGESTIKGILKIRKGWKASEICSNDFQFYRPKEWPNKKLYPTYYAIEDAQMVVIPLGELKDGKGLPKNSNAMREMSFVDWEKFIPF